MNIETDTVHKQLERLMRGGLSIEDACSALQNLGFTKRELAPIQSGLVIRQIGRAAGPPRRSTASVEARSNSLPPDPDPLFQGWDKPRSRRWDKLISRARFAVGVLLDLATVALILAGVAFTVDRIHSLPFSLAIGVVAGVTSRRAVRSGR